MAGTPTPRRKRLGTHIRAVRERSASSVEDVAALLKLDESSVSRYETGHIRPPWSSLQVMLMHYNATEEERTKAAELWEDAGQRAVRLAVPAGSSKAFRSLLRAESEAVSVRVLSTLAVHGLLQTPDYVRAIQASGHQVLDPGTNAEHYVIARLKRQERVTGDEPLRLHALLDEVVVRRVVGGPAVMAGQLRHLLDMGRRPNVTIQVIPFSAGSYGTMSGGCTIIGYDDAEYQPAVYIEHTAGGEWVEDIADVQRLESMFGETVEASLGPDESAGLIRSALKALGDR